MTDEYDNGSGEKPGESDEESQGPRAGQRLAEARRARDISIAEVAKELHLDEPKVQALEENQFQVLGAPVFAKGHLRKYAELVGVNVDDVLTDYYKLNRATGAPPVVGPVRKPQRDIRIGPWVVSLLVIGAAAAVVYWYITRPTAPEVVRTPGVLEPYADSAGAGRENPTESMDSGSPGAPEAADEEIDSGQTDEVQAADTTAEPAVETPVPDVASRPSAAVPADASGQVRLTMSFSGDCWTEVTDADGKRLFFGLGQAGQTVTRTGTPPLHALFGDRNNVSVTVNGSEFLLTSGGLRGNTARVTIDNP